MVAGTAITLRTHAHTHSKWPIIIIFLCLFIHGCFKKACAFWKGQSIFLKSLVSHSVGGSPLHKDLSPSCREIFTKASYGTNKHFWHILINFVSKAMLLLHSYTHQCPTEMCWGFVPAGAAGSILTHIDVIHQSVTIQETFPCEKHTINHLI